MHPARDRIPTPIAIGILVTITTVTMAAMTPGAAVALGRRVRAPAQDAIRTDGTRTVWDGVYTDSQARRGRTTYEASCRTCHEGGPGTGSAFARDWNGTGLDDLFGQIKGTMPPSAPASLSDREYLDIVAYVLQANAFPAGPDELIGDALAGIRIQGRDGPEPVPDFALVRTVGCLARADAAWVLTDAGAPVRTRNPEASTDDERRESEAAALGATTFELMNVYPSPDPYDGHKVEAKGFLIRNPEGDRLNVTAVQTLAPRCEP
jgi:cytochrome c5